MSFTDSWAPYQDEEDGYDVAAIPDMTILGLADGYDDPRIDAVIHAYLTCRKYVRKIREIRDINEPPWP